MQRNGLVKDSIQVKRAWKRAGKYGTGLKDFMKGRRIMMERRGDTVFNTFGLDLSVLRWTQRKGV